jgi:enoyl-CoA hydratase/carnithine racemase
MNALVTASDPHPGVRVIAMNRPDKKNALTREMYDALVGARDADQHSVLYRLRPRELGQPQSAVA